MLTKHTQELENLQKLRATLEAIKESTDKMLQDISTIYKDNNPQLLQNSKDFQKALNDL